VTTVPVSLPQWGMGMSMGTVLQWFKQVGDEVAVDDVLVEVEAEKTTDVVYSPAAGLLSVILAEVGAEMAVGDTLAEIVVAE
jgi:pyruvate/2-oxoglutarate dehydrogenase complex dihydrolipoamide acyltransferase (E2) component